MLASRLAIWTVFAVAPTAEPDTDILRWTAPSSCPSRDDVWRSTLELVGPDGVALHGVQVEARIEAGPDGSFDMRLRLKTASGTTDRTMNALSCETLAEATSLAMVIAADEARALRLMQSTARSTPTPGPAPVEGRRPALGGSVEIATGLSSGALPGFGPFLTLAAGLRWPRFGLAGYGGHWFARTGSLEAAPQTGAAGRFSLWLGGVRGCTYPTLGRVQFPICLAAEGGHVLGEGEGIQNPRRNRQPWGAVTGGAGLTWHPIPALGVFAGIQAVVPFVRPAFEIEELGTVYRASPVGARSQLGLEARFP